MLRGHRSNLVIRKPLSKEPSCVILGAGGHARVIIETIQIIGEVGLVGVLDRDAKVGTQVGHLTVLGDDQWLAHARARGVNKFVVGVGSVGIAETRRNLFALGIKHGMEPVTVCHPRALISVSVELARGCQVLVGSIVNTGSRIGENAIINSGAVVEHDCDIGAHAHIACGAILAGGVKVGAGAHVGAGATVLQGIIIGDEAIIGAGAVVVKDVARNSTVIGVPARLFERKVT